MEDTEQGVQEGAVSPLCLTLLPGGSTFTLTHPDVLVGRHSDADVCLHLPDVSRRHCRFRFHDENWHIYDLKSTNGVYVNDEQVGQAQIHDADRIRIGGYTFAVRVGAAAAESPASHTNTIQTSESAGISADRSPRRKAS